MSRFKREAHVLASLNHPHIAAIYGLEEADGKPFLALELVEGEDLKERLVRGAIPVAEALEIARQVAEALEAAHNKGIVHRDLKPANVKLTPDGTVKVLDFGLAKAWAGEAADGSSSALGALAVPHAGPTPGPWPDVILGTAAYMWPEPRRGKPVDKRADVWSFGVLLRETLTGRTLFRRRHGDRRDRGGGDAGARPRRAARRRRRPRSGACSRRCLRKDPRTRLPDIGAARLELQDVLAGTRPQEEAPGSDSGKAAEAERQARRKERWAWAAVARRPGRSRGRARVRPPEGGAATAASRRPVRGRCPGRLGASTAGAGPIPSPDGSQIVFRAVPEGAANDRPRRPRCCGPVRSSP